MRIRTVAALTVLWVLGTSAPALAQLESPKSIEELEREASKPKKKQPPPSDEEDSAGSDAADTADDTAAEAPPRRAKAQKARAADGDDDPSASAAAPSDGDAPASATREGTRPKVDDEKTPATKAPATGTQVKLPEAALGTEASTAPAARPGAKPLLLPHTTDAELVAIWARWRKATAELDLKAADASQAELVRLRDDLGIADLEGFSVGFLRAAESKQRANDALGAVQLATVATALAPDLPYAHLGLAQAYFAAEPGSVGRVIDEAKLAVRSLMSDPRYLRPVLADLGAALVFALMATAVAVVLVMFLRKARYFLHDFHHLFPRGTARWQSAIIAMLLLALPWVLHLGIAPTLIALLLAVSLYLSPLERGVAAALIALLGAVPILGAQLVVHTAFEGTVAEDVYELEHGGIEAHGAADRVLRRNADGKAGFAELFALGRYELRRGDLDRAMEHLKAAAGKKNGDARLLVNLGNAMLAKGDPDGALDIYRNATQVDEALAAGFFNLSKVYYRRAASLPNDQVGLELDKAHNALQTAQRIDERLLLREDPPEDNLQVNRLLLAPSLTTDEIVQLADAGEASEKVRAQLSLSVAGTSSLVGTFYPVLAALALFGFGFLNRRMSAAKTCDKCGRAVCRRCDPELGVGSLMCGQCVNVFARKGVVAAPLKVRKQVEVDRYHARMERLSTVFGLVCSGAGHLFSGLPIRGALYAFAFLFVAFSAFFRQGILRAPYGTVPTLIQLVPLGVVFLAVYLLSLRGLYKRQEG